jgi:hypothetical protein
MNKPCQITSVSVRKPTGRSDEWVVRISGRAGVNTLHVTDKGKELGELLKDIDHVFAGAAAMKGLVPDV